MEYIALFIILLTMLVILVVVLTLATLFQWLIGKISYDTKQKQKPISK